MVDELTPENEALQDTVQKQAIDFAELKGKYDSEQTITTENTADNERKREAMNAMLENAKAEIEEQKVQLKAKSEEISRLQEEITKTSGDKNAVDMKATEAESRANDLNQQLEVYE